MSFGNAKLSDVQINDTKGRVEFIKGLNIFMKVFLVICMILSVQLSADKLVTKTTFINQANYADKSLEEIEAILLEKVKIDAATEIYGDFIKSETDIENGKMIRNQIVSEKNGLVHLMGEPVYANGKNFGDIQVTVQAYATDEELSSMSVHKIQVENFVYANENTPLNKIKREAEDAFLVYALSQKKPSLLHSTNKRNLARKLAVSIDMRKMVFDVKNGSYTMSGTVGYVPFFLQNYN